MEKEDKITEFHKTYGSPRRRDQIPEYRMPDENGILKNPGIGDRDRQEDESPDPPREVRSNAVYGDRFFGRLHAGPAEPYMRRNAYHGVHDLLRLLKENKPTESTGRAAPPQSATGTVLTTQRTCTPKSKDETSRRHPETQRERPGTPTNNTQTFIWRAPDLFQTNLTGSTNKTTKNPDVIRKHTFTGETFAAECKHRSEIRYDPEKKHPLHPMVNPEQISRHKNFSKTENIPVFIVLGTRGDPKDPEHVFCIPHNNIKYPEIYESIFEKIIPKRSSVYRNGNLFRLSTQISVS